jgi:cellulose biosynthesis protein BcsQ
MINDFDDDISKLEAVEVIGSVESTDTIEEDLKDLIREDPDVVILNRYIFESAEDVVKLIKILRKVRMDQRFIIITGKYEKDFIQPIVNIGIYDFIIEDFSLSNIKEILENQRLEFDFTLYEGLKLASKEKTKTLDITLPFTPKVLIKSVFKETITFYSPLSNTLKISEEYASYLAKKGFKVLLLDYNFMNPNHYKSKDDLYTLIDKFEQGHNIFDYLESCKITKSKVDYLSAAFNFYEYYHMDYKVLYKAVDELKSKYDYIVINTSPYATDRATSEVIRYSDKIYLVSESIKYEMLETINSYIALISDRMHGHIEGIIIDDFASNSITSIELAAKLDRNVLAYINPKWLKSESKLVSKFYKTKLHKEFEKLGR